MSYDSRGNERENTHAETAADRLAAFQANVARFETLVEARRVRLVRQRINRNILIALLWAVAFLDQVACSYAGRGFANGACFALDAGIVAWNLIRVVRLLKQRSEMKQ